MADLTITAADVKKTDSTLIAEGIAGGTVTAGQPVYKDSTASNKLKAADADVLASAAAVGIALHGASADQPLKYAIGGNLTLSNVMTAGAVYVVSTNAGGIAPVADLGAGDFVTLLGIATSATNLKISISVSATAKA
jgi:hypothetical protein